MATDPTPMLVNSEILLGTLEAANELGIDLDSLLQRHAIAEEELRNPKGFLAFTQVVKFLNDVAHVHNCPLFGFHAGRHQPPLRFGHLAQLPKLCSTVGEAMEKSLRYSSAYNQASQWTQEKEGEFLLLKRFHRDTYSESLEQLHTLAVTVMIKAMGVLPPTRSALASIYLSHREPEGSEILRRFFKVPVHFNHSFSGYAVHKKIADVTIPTANPELLALIEHQLNQHDHSDSDDLLSRTKQTIRNTLGTTICSIDGVSQSLSVHPRTLQRELKAQHTSFRDILTGIRQETAEHYLLFSDISVVDLSDLLGYQNSTAFIRAFKRASGLPPMLWQQANL